TAAGENHGTAVAGVAAAVGNNTIGISGAAPQSEIAALRVATSVDVAQALHYDNNIDVYNNSYGFSPFRPISTLELDALRAGITQGRGGLGSIYVFSAGNSGASGDRSDYEA